MRAFLGISIPNDLKEKILTIQEKFSDFDIKIVEIENLHFNLKFFREIGEKGVDRLKETLTKKLENNQSFNVNISGLGTFPKKEYAKVVWLGVKQGKEEMLTLSKSIDDVYGVDEFEKIREFVPHLTLGRMRSGKDREKFLETIKELENIEIGFMNVNKIIMFSSVLGPSGPKYNKVFSIKLNHQQ